MTLNRKEIKVGDKIIDHYDPFGGGFFCGIIEKFLYDESDMGIFVEYRSSDNKIHQASKISKIECKSEEESIETLCWISVLKRFEEALKAFTVFMDYIRAKNLKF